jgi:hypothetical protein
MDDIEQTASWLQGLARLNAVIAATGQPLAGNLCYDHLEEDFVDKPPNPIFRAKRDRLRKAVEGRTRMLEVGVNGGHSAYVALTVNLALEFHGVDICEHAYVRPAVAHLQREFPGRVFFHEGDSLEVLPRLVQSRQRFDLFHLDGAKRTYLEDILNCERMLAGERAMLIMDDTQQVNVAGTWNVYVGAGAIEPHPDFPSMPETEAYRNEIGTLKALPAGKRGSFVAAARARRRLHGA